MREYGIIHTAYWSSIDVQAMTDTGKLLGAYLLTGPHSNGIGAYRLPDGYVMADLGWTTETLAKGFAELDQRKVSVPAGLKLQRIRPSESRGA